jgi:hypothetical protein
MIEAMQKKIGKSWFESPSKCPCSPESSVTAVSNSSDSLQLDDSLWNLQESTTSEVNNGKNGSKVRFGIIQMRDYERIASDNPAVQSGVPIG